MIRKEFNQIVWLEFELLADFKELSHGVLLRHGGCSSGAFDSLNLGFSTDNVIENQNVKENRSKVKKIFQFDNLNDCKLEHGDKIFEIMPANNESRPVCDGLVTDHRQMTLMVTHADCQGAIFYDPIKKALAAVHSGWRGNVKNIYEKTVHAMMEKYGCKSTDLHVCISPSLGPLSAEFMHFRKELPESFWDYQVKPHYFDLWTISKDQLKAAGVLEHHIQIACIDTLTNSQDLFSYRREKISGRNATFCMLHSE